MAGPKTDTRTGTVTYGTGGSTSVPGTDADLLTYNPLTGYSYDSTLGISPRRELQRQIAENAPIEMPAGLSPQEQAQWLADQQNAAYDALGTWHDYSAALGSVAAAQQRDQQVADILSGVRADALSGRTQDIQQRLAMGGTAGGVGQAAARSGMNRTAIAQSGAQNLTSAAAQTPLTQMQQLNSLQQPTIGLIQNSIEDQNRMAQMASEEAKLRTAMKIYGDKVGSEGDPNWMNILAGTATGAAGGLIAGGPVGAVLGGVTGGGLTAYNEFSGAKASQDAQNRVKNSAYTGQGGVTGGTGNGVRIFGKQY